MLDIMGRQSLFYILLVVLLAFICADARIQQELTFGRFNRAGKLCCSGQKQQQRDFNASTSKGPLVPKDVIPDPVAAAVSKPARTAGVRETEMAPGSKPPSCINKCASCTPCQLVKASQQGKEEELKVGSTPPSCKNKCNKCVPCQAVQAPMNSPHEPAGDAEERRSGHFTVGFSNYMPETWKCKCGNQFFSP